ncbi:MAG: hypothetical protein COB04_05190 [Gammaproteobacteria bacterium]|nr:MAG: hypothetical protein COB04_06860 [Gammaproteobacteria bacterium]PCJ19704.1 MAG: hypothetical protein COB04_05190 [Gammaproteobacteria bacterium]
MTEITIDPKQRRNNRIKLICLIALPVITVVLSTAMFKTGIGLPSGTKNKGTLIQPPQQIEDLSFTTQGGNPFDYKPGSKWSLILPSYGDCNEACEQRLFLTRQVHVLLGKNAGAVRRFYVNIGAELSTQALEQLATEHPKLKVINSTQENFKTFSDTLAIEDKMLSETFFLVDPRGFIMMYYTDQNTDKELIKDLKFLITKSGGH